MWLVIASSLCSFILWIIGIFIAAELGFYDGSDLLAWYWITTTIWLISAVIGFGSIWVYSVILRKK